MFFSDRHEAAIVKALTGASDGLSESRLQAVSSLPKKDLGVYLDSLSNEGLIKRKGPLYVLSNELRAEIDGDREAADATVNAEIITSDPEESEDDRAVEADEDDDEPLSEEDQEELARELQDDGGTLDPEYVERWAGEPPPKAKPVIAPLGKPRSSQYLGVSKKGKSWMVQGSLGNGQMIRMQTFPTELEAAQHYDSCMRTQAADPASRRYNFPRDGEKNQSDYFAITGPPKGTGAKPHAKPGPKHPPPVIPAAAPAPKAALREIVEPIVTPVMPVPV